MTKSAVSISIIGPTRSGKSAIAQALHDVLKYTYGIEVLNNDQDKLRAPEMLTLALETIGLTSVVTIAVDRVARPPEPPPPVETDGWEWCFLEIMGHRSHWGRAREEERFGSKMIRVDVPIKGDPANGWATHYYGGASIFSYSLADEGTVMKRNKPYEPPSRLSIAAPVPEDDDLPFDDGGPYNEVEG